MFEVWTGAVDSDGFLLTATARLTIVHTVYSRKFSFHTQNGNLSIEKTKTKQISTNWHRMNLKKKDKREEREREKNHQPKSKQHVF